MKCRPLVGIVLLTLFFAAPSLAGGDKVNSSLKLLKTLRERPPAKLEPQKKLASALAADRAVVTVKFDHVLSSAEVTAYEAAGVFFYYMDGEPARTRAIYPVRVPWDFVDEFTARSEVVRVESQWRPAMLPALDVSGPEIEADLVWDTDDPLGYPVTGQGMRVADFDTGIDVFHPSFYYADGDTLDWFDADSNELFTPGVDAIDLNGSGTVEPGENLYYTDGWIMDYAHVFNSGDRANDDLIYQASWDWLYVDLNNNMIRDFGPGNGFTESDPTFGEPFFIALDDNHNDILDPGEKVVALGTCKIAGSMNTGAVTRQRGVDLMDSDLDTNGHGTSVCGILAGNTARRHRFAGIAPDAEILAGNVFSDVPLSLLIPWARSMGADAMLYEFGSFIYEFLDGSSLDEELVSIEHQTTVQITPSGNLARGTKHAVAAVPPMDSVTLTIVAPPNDGILTALWGTTLWREAMDFLEFRLETPLGSEVTLVPGEQLPDFFYVWADFATSDRSTKKLDIYIEKLINQHVIGRWKLKIVNKSHQTIEVISNVADEVTSWSGGAGFENYVSNTQNVTLPATADYSLVNGSYSTRGFESYGGDNVFGPVDAGSISEFSGRGKRIDGHSQLDVCSPGNYDVYTSRSHSDPAAYPPGSYRQFSGTSAAGPHVAAAAALVQQAFPGIAAGQVEHLIRQGAYADTFTGAVPNETWGNGKLRILNALNVAVGVTEMADGLRAPALHLDPNFPNPFNPTTWIPFYLPSDGHATLKIFNVRGQLVKVLRDRRYTRGPHSVVWDGTDEKGAGVASGLYFSELRQGPARQTLKMTLIR